MSARRAGRADAEVTSGVASLLDREMLVQLLRGRYEPAEAEYERIFAIWRRQLLG